MLIDRRRLVAGIGFAALAGRAAVVRADRLADYWPKAQEVFTRRWGGRARADTDQATINLGIWMAINVSADRIFWGTQRLRSNWDGDTYNATYNISGSLWSSDRGVGLTIEKTGLQSGDSLPSNLFWQALIGDLEMTREEGTADQYILGGTLRGSADSTPFSTQLSDHYDG